MKVFVFFIFLVGAVSSTHAQIWGARNYEDCILREMKGVKSDYAAKAIIQACSEKFPSKQTQSQPTSKEKVSCPVENNTCRLRLFNGNLSCRHQGDRIENSRLYSFNLSGNGIRVIIETPKNMGTDAVEMWGVINSHHVYEICSSN